MTEPAASRSWIRASFSDPFVTATGERRAQVALQSARDAVVQHRHAVQPDLPPLLHRIVAKERPAGLSERRRGGRIPRRDRSGCGLGTWLIGFTGGEPFMNPELPAMLDDVLSRGFRALVLTNAMKPMHKMQAGAAARCGDRYGDRLTIRVSIDHYGRARARDWSAAGAAGSRRSTGCDGWPRTGSRVACRQPPAVGRTGSGDPPRLRRLFAELGVRDRRRRPGRADGVSGDGRGRRRAGDHRGVLGHPRQVAGERHVRDLAHGRQSARARRARRSSPARCCPTTRASSSGRPWPRRARPGAAQPPALRQVLRARRRRLQPRVIGGGRLGSGAGVGHTARSTRSEKQRCSTSRLPAR